MPATKIEIATDPIVAAILNPVMTEDGMGVIIGDCDERWGGPIYGPPPPDWMFIDIPDDGKGEEGPIPDTDFESAGQHPKER